MLDLSNEFGRRVAGRLQEENVIWLTTTGSDLTPQPRPVWFVWDGETFLIYSQPHAHKLRHIARNPKVALNLDSDGQGGDIMVITGQAYLAEDTPRANEVPAYMEKYRDGIAGIGMSPEEFAQSYSVAVRVRPAKLRGH